MKAGDEADSVEENEDRIRQESSILEKKEDETQQAEAVVMSSKTIEDEEEEAFNNAPTSLDATEGVEVAKESQSGEQKVKMTEAEKMAALSSEESSTSSEESSSDDGGF